MTTSDTGSRIKSRTVISRIMSAIIIWFINWILSFVLTEPPLPSGGRETPVNGAKNQCHKPSLSLPEGIGTLLYQNRYHLWKITIASHSDNIQQTYFSFPTTFFCAYKILLPPISHSKNMIQKRPPITRRSGKIAETLCGCQRDRIDSSW